MPTFEFTTRRPEASLGRFVESVWHARGQVAYKRERIAPTGSTVAILVLGDALRQTADDGRGPTVTTTEGLVIGPHDRPILNEPLGRTHAVGVVTTSFGCEAALRFRPAPLRGRIETLAAHWPGSVALRTALLETRDPLSMLALVEATLTAQLDESVPGLSRCAEAIAALETDPARPIRDVAAMAGISHGHLDREFTRLVGLTPRVLARLLKLRRLLANLDVNNAPSWTRLAAQFGWFDQAHFIRDFKRHTGVTPNAYLREQRAAFAPDERADAAGFVPESRDRR